MARQKKASDTQPGEVLGIGHIDTSVNRDSGISPTSTANDIERRRDRVKRDPMPIEADELTPGLNDDDSA